jgi:hypothetical protein
VGTRITKAIAAVNNKLSSFLVDNLILIEFLIYFLYKEKNKER